MGIVGMFDGFRIGVLSIPMGTAPNLPGRVLVG